MKPPELRTNLDRLGLSQAEFARLSSTSRAAVSLWCSGRNPIAPWVTSWLAMFEAMTPAQRLALMPTRDVEIF